MNEHFEYLKSITPFNLLSDEVLMEVSTHLVELNYREDKVIYQQEVSKLKGVDIIVKGVYESFFYDSGKNKRVPEIHEPGFCYGGVSVLLNQRQSLRTVIAKKGCLVYFLHRKYFRELCKTSEPFFQYFAAEFGKRMQNEEFVHFFKRPISAEENFTSAEDLFTRKLETTELRAIVQCDKNTPIFEAARLMAINKISCLFITDQTGEIFGYVTDITLRDRVIAQQRAAAAPVADVTESPVISMDASALAYEAALMMFRTKTRYLLVNKANQYIGFISRNKLLSDNAQSPLTFIQSVKSAISDDELRRKWHSVPQFVSQLLNRGVNAQIANQVITTIADTIAQKVIENVIEELGTPPAKFVFMVLGSEGRKEQTFKTDQDNAIIYEDKANEHREMVRDYFLEFADRVSGKLDHIGFSFCTGGFMAKNPKWTHSLSHWKKNYQYWMDESIPETVINFSTFFDCRSIYGDTAIMDELHEFLDKELQMHPSEKLFFHMAKNALQYEPPLTFFKGIRTFTKGSREVFDIKKVMSPIVDLVRVYALKNRIFAVNTGERLWALKQQNIFTDAEYNELSQSYYLLMNMRLKNQSGQIITDHVEADNYIEISRLTTIEKVTLKEIFNVIKNFQTKIKLQFTGGLLG